MHVLFNINTMVISNICCNSSIYNNCMVIRLFAIYMMMAVGLTTMTCSSSNSTSCNTTTNTAEKQHQTEYSKLLEFNHVMLATRKKRYIVYPPGSGCTAAMAFALPIVGQTPSGLRLTAEADFYYPLQMSIEQWYPKTTQRPRTTTEEITQSTATPTATTTMEYIQEKINERLDKNKRRRIVNTVNQATMFVSKAIAMRSPGGLLVITEFDFFYPMPTKVSDWQFKKPPPVPLHLRKTTNTLDDDYINRPGEIKVSALSNENQLPNYYDYEKNNWKKNYQSNNNYQYQPNSYKYLNRTNQPYYYQSIQRPISTWQVPLKSETNYWYKNKWPSTKFGGEQKKRPFDIEEHRDWEHYYGHKHRRDIYEQFESIAKFNGFDIKSCILRLICEARHYLLPPGISFFQDVLRILFAVPLKDTMNDEYSNAMRTEKEDCQSIYSSKCQYSILGYLLHQTRKDFIY